MSTKKTYRPHFSSTSDARVLRSREALRSAMLKLIETKSLDQITISEITSLAGIGRTTFFRHYPSKEALVEEIAAQEIRQLIDSTLDATAELIQPDTRQTSLALFKYVAKHRQLWKTLLTGGAANTMRDEFTQMACEVATNVEQKSEWLPADAGIVIVVSSTIELIAWWLTQQKPVSVQKIADIYNRAILSPIYLAT